MGMGTLRHVEVGRSGGTLHWTPCAHPLSRNAFCMHPPMPITWPTTPKRASLCKRSMTPPSWWVNWKPSADLQLPKTWLDTAVCKEIGKVSCKVLDTIYIINIYRGPNRFWPGSGLVLRCLGPGFTVLALGPGFRPIFIHIYIYIL